MVECEKDRQRATCDCATVYERPLTGALSSSLGLGIARGSSRPDQRSVAGRAFEWKLCEKRGTTGGQLALPIIHSLAQD